MKILSLLMLLLAVWLLAPGEGRGVHPESQEEDLAKTNYYHLADTTLIYMDLGPLRLNPSHRTEPLRMQLSARYEGKNKIKPDFVRLEVSGYSRWSPSDGRKPRLLIFADGVALDGGKPGKDSYYYSVSIDPVSIDYEWMQFTLPFDQFLQVAKARTVRSQLDEVNVELTDNQLKSLRAFAKELQQRPARPTPSIQNSAAALQSQGISMPEILSLRGRVLGRGRNRQPTGPRGVLTYLVDEVTLPRALEVEIRGQRKRVTRFFRVTIYATAFRTGGLPYFIDIGNESLGIGMENLYVGGFSAVTFDRSLIREGATLTISQGADHTELPEKLNLDLAKRTGEEAVYSPSRPKIPNPAADLEGQGLTLSEVLKLPGRVLARGDNSKPVGQIKVTGYLVEELTLPQSVEVEIRGKKKRVTRAFRVTIFGETFPVGSLGYYIGIEDESLGMGMEHPKLDAVTAVTFDRSLIREGATLSISYAGVGYTELPEKLKLNSGKKRDR